MSWIWRIVLPGILFCNLFAAPDPANPLSYKTDITTIQALGRDLYRSLGSADKALLSPEPVSLDTSLRPSIRLYTQRNGAGTAIRGVWVSTGFIDLANRLAHAKAIDKRRKGYLRRYLEVVQRSEDQVPELPERDTPLFWTDDMLNEQRSSFNSIAATLVGINLAHHYLGHYQKYAALLENSERGQAPMNGLLTRTEWEESYQSGIRDAMTTGCMTE